MVLDDVAGRCYRDMRREPRVLAHVLAPRRGGAGWCEVSRSQAVCVCVRLSVPGGSCLASGG